jgi:hypothetical protein
VVPLELREERVGREAREEDGDARPRKAPQHDGHPGEREDEEAVPPHHAVGPAQEIAGPFLERGLEARGVGVDVLFAVHHHERAGVARPPGAAEHVPVHAAIEREHHRAAVDGPEERATVVALPHHEGERRCIEEHRGLDHHGGGDERARPPALLLHQAPEAAQERGHQQHVDGVVVDVVAKARGHHHRHRGHGRRGHPVREARGVGAHEAEGRCSHQGIEPAVEEEDAEQTEREVEGRREDREDPRPKVVVLSPRAEGQVGEVDAEVAVPAELAVVPARGEGILERAVIEDVLVHVGVEASVPEEPGVGLDLRGHVGRDQHQREEREGDGDLPVGHAGRRG